MSHLNEVDIRILNDVVQECCHLRFALKLSLNVETEVHDVAILHYIIFAFDA